jgi:hypothetical protein
MPFPDCPCRIVTCREIEYEKQVEKGQIKICPQHKMHYRKCECASLNPNYCQEHVIDFDNCTCEIKTCEEVEKKMGSKPINFVRVKHCPEHKVPIADCICIVHNPHYCLFHHMKFLDCPCEPVTNNSKSNQPGDHKFCPQHQKDVRTCLCSGFNPFYCQKHRMRFDFCPCPVTTHNDVLKSKGQPTTKQCPQHKVELVACSCLPFNTGHCQHHNKSKHLCECPVVTDDPKFRVAKFQTMQESPLPRRCTVTHTSQWRQNGCTTWSHLDGTFQYALSKSLQDLLAPNRDKKKVVRTGPDYKTASAPVNIPGSRADDDTSWRRRRYQNAKFEEHLGEEADQRRTTYERRYGRE